MEAQDLAVAQEKCAAERRLIVFIDESGLSERPTRVRTWALKVCTLLVLFHFNWKHVSAVAGLTRSSFLFRLYDGAVKSAQIVEFLKALRAHLKRKLLNAWDGAAQHKSRIVREYLDGTKGSAQMALLPAYSPDLNPVEYLWARLKRHALANFCPKSLAELKTPRATSCAAVNTASRSSLRAGSRTSCGDVLAYVKFNNEDQYSQRWAPQSTPMVACLRGRLVCVR